MREKYEGQGLERLIWTVVVLAGVCVVALVGLAGWGVWTWIS